MALYLTPTISTSFPAPSYALPGIAWFPFPQLHLPSLPYQNQAITWLAGNPTAGWGITRNACARKCPAKMVDSLLAVRLFWG